MCKAKFEFLESYLKGHIDETKVLGEWRILINEQLPKKYRLTSRELAHAFGVITRRDNEILLEREATYYRVCSSPSLSTAQTPMALVQ